jgi:hypothetical protein
MVGATATMMTPPAKPAAKRQRKNQAKGAWMPQAKKENAHSEHHDTEEGGGPKVFHERLGEERSHQIARQVGGADVSSVGGRKPMCHDKLRAPRSLRCSAPLADDLGDNITQIGGGGR